MSQDIHLDSLTKENLARVNEIAAVWDTLGWIYFKQGNLKLAESYLNASWILCESDVVGDHLGQIYERQGRGDDALHSYSLALASNRGPNPNPATKRLHEKINARIAALKASGAKVKPFKAPQGLGGDEIGLERSTLMPRLTSDPTSADFYVLFSPGGVVDVKFIKGDAALKTCNFTDQRSRSLMFCSQRAQRSEDPAPRHPGMFSVTWRYARFVLIPITSAAVL